MECMKDSPPSQLPLATILTVPSFLQSTSTASIWPSKLLMNGFANILSILAAFRARVRSRARAKGWSKGSRLREVGVGSPGLVGRCADGSCWRTEIFWTGRDYHDGHDQGWRTYHDVRFEQFQEVAVRYRDVSASQQSTMTTIQKPSIYCTVLFSQIGFQFLNTVNVVNSPLCQQTSPQPVSGAYFSEVTRDGADLFENRFHDAV